MTRVIRLRAEAENDIFEAASWYESQRLGLGHDFLDAAEAVFQLIAEHPSQYPLLHRKHTPCITLPLPIWCLLSY